MTVKECVEAALECGEKTHYDVARSMGVSERLFTRRLNSGTFTAEQFLQICDICGVDVRLVLRRNEADIFAQCAGVGKRVRRVVNGMVYDTEHAVAMSNNFDASVIPARELYRDRDGNYFFAEYSGTERDKIVPCDSEDAAKFISENGLRTRNK